MNLVILVILFLSMATLVSMMIASRNVSRVHLPRTQALAQFETDLAIGHLWFEEILAGDRTESIDLVWDLWEEAECLAQALIEGGATEFGEVVPLQAPEHLEQMREILGQLEEFRNVADQRFSASMNSFAGSEIDQQFDWVFGRLLENAQASRKNINILIAQEEKKFKTLQWVLVIGNILLALVLFLVITRYERRQETDHWKLAASEKHYRLMFQTAAEGIIVADEQTGNILDANHAMSRMIGRTREQLLEMSVADVHSPETAEKVVREFDKLRYNPDLWNQELEFIHRDGHIILVEAHASFLEQDGRPCVVGFFTDRTHRKIAQEEKDHLESQLRQAQKMEAIGNLAGGIAHDFNNLLQAIQGYAELILDSGESPPDVRKDVENIYKASARAADLTRQLLTFSRRQVISPVDLDLNQVIPDHLKILKRLIGENIQLRFLSGHHLGSVCMDKGQLEQVLMNLCLNARDAIGKSGEVIIETENVQVDEEFSRNHDWAEEGRYVLLSVTDTGVGMDHAVLEKAFEPFFTTKEVGQGTGLGLATVYGIVKQNGGMVHAYSEVGKGSTFKIYLPLVERSATQVGNKIPGSLKGGSETILLAEDDQWVRDLAQRILADAGYSVLVAGTGKEALEIFRNHRETVDLALLDVVMPEMGGREVQEAIHAHRPRVKVLFASGYSQNAIHTDFVLDKGRVMISKPYSRDVLLRHVREVLDSD